MKKIWILSVLLSGVLCAAYSQASISGLTNNVTTITEDSTQRTILYVYREGRFVGAAIGYDLYVGDQLVGRVKNNSKFEVVLPKTDKVEVWAKTESKDAVMLEIKPGEKYYLKCSLKMGIAVGRPDLTLVDSRQGEADYAKVKSSKK